MAMWSTLIYTANACVHLLFVVHLYAATMITPNESMTHPDNNSAENDFIHNNNKDLHKMIAEILEKVQIYLL